MSKVDDMKDMNFESDSEFEVDIVRDEECERVYGRVYIYIINDLVIS